MKGEMTLREFLELALRENPQGFRIKRYAAIDTIIAIPDKLPTKVNKSL